MPNAQETGIITGNAEVPKGETRTYVVRVRTGSAEYEGEMFSPYPGQRLSEVLARIQSFINLKGARDLATDEKFPFVVISKDHIETIKVLEEK